MSVKITKPKKPPTKQESIATLKSQITYYKSLGDTSVNTKSLISSIEKIIARLEKATDK